MGKRKRSRSRSKSDIRAKVRKLERKLERYKKRAESPPTSSISQDVTDQEWSANEFEYEDDLTNHDLLLEDQEPIPGPSGSNKCHRSVHSEPVVEDSTIAQPCVTDVTNANSHSTNNPAHQADALDPEILQMLGDDPNNQNDYGENIHNDLASRWSHIVTNGLDKEIKQDLLKKYTTPQNCKSLRAPKLNLEVKAALNDISIKKDFYSQTKQNQLSSALSAMGSALNIILTSKDVSMQKLVKPLSDAARLICDCHYKESVSRRFEITKILNKDTKDMVKNSKIDEYLFGSDLADQLKTHKAITRSGLEMKATNNSRIPFKQSMITQNQRGTLNARGATRAVVGGSRRNPTLRRPPLPPPPTRDRRHPRQAATAAAATRNFSSRDRITRRRY